VAVVGCAKVVRVVVKTVVGNPCGRVEGSGIVTAYLW
jgi:hypothetical protein